MKRSLLAMLLAVSVAVCGTSVSHALYSPTNLTDTLKTTVNTTRAQTTQSDSTEDKQLELEARKQELEQKLADKRAAISQKLIGARAERCQKKQININSMLDKRVEKAQKHFDTFKAIQVRLVSLVDEKEIVVENRAALELIMTTLEAKTQGSITVLGTTDFKCEDADASAPGAIVKDQVAVAKQDLKNYRDAIKDYAQAIKASVAPASETSTDETPSEEAPVAETPSTEQSIEGVSQ